MDNALASNLPADFKDDCDYSYQSVYQYNDRFNGPDDETNTTEADIIALYDRAIESLEE